MTKLLYLGLSLLIILGISITTFLIIRINGNHTFATAEIGTFEEIVKVSGNITPIREVNLGFTTSGIVDVINFDVNERVQRGQEIVRLDTSSVLSDLDSAQANLAITRSELINSQVNLESVTEKYDTLVENARITLFSGGLIAEPRNNSQTQTPPTISGRYSGPSGEYKIILDTSKTNSNEIDMNVFGPESKLDIRISKTAPTAMGDYGLFIDFADTLSSYKDTIWYVTIPNTTSSVYTANLNAYESAQRERENAIKDALDTLRVQEQGLSIIESQRQQAQSSVRKIEQQLSDRSITAPFDGIITMKDAEVGEIIQAGNPLISMIGDEGLKLEVYIPEVHIVKINIGQRAHITLDAYGPSQLFEAEIVSIDPAETLRDGIPTYKTTLHFTQENTGIRPGMTADATIVTDRREDILLIPRRAILETDSRMYVLVATDETGKKIEERDVNIGAYDSYGNAEVLSGLSAGESVVTNPER